MDLDLCAGELEGDKPRNHDGTGPRRREDKGKQTERSLEFMMEVDPIAGKTKGDKT